MEKINKIIILACLSIIVIYVALYFEFSTSSSPTSSSSSSTPSFSFTSSSLFDLSHLLSSSSSSLSSLSKADSINYYCLNQRDYQRLASYYLDFFYKHKDNRLAIDGQPHNQIIINKLCKFENFDGSSARELIYSTGRNNITFIGDSVCRYLFLSLVNIMDTNAPSRLVNGSYHANIYWDNHDTHLRFLWKPFAKDISNSIQNLFDNSSADLNQVYVICDGPWDMLHTRNANEYKDRMKDIARKFHMLRNSRQWKLIMTEIGTIVDSKLKTAEKKKYLTEKIAKVYRGISHRAIRQSAPKSNVRFLYLKDITENKESETLDGIHYSINGSYNRAAQILLNLIKHS